MTPTELQEELDKRMSLVIEQLRREANMGSVSFSGGVTGFLLKTAVALAVEGGCPKKVLLKSMQDIIQESYEPEARSL